MKNAPPKTTFLKDYRALPFRVSTIDLIFDLDDSKTLVTNTMKIECLESGKTPLVLNGEAIKLISVKLDGQTLDEGAYTVDEKFLAIENVPERFELEIVTEIDPKGNTALDGLYKSGSIFCTQNEPEGFRRITYYFDRPDMMSLFTTKIIADKKKCPIMLSNGNEVDKGELPDGKHWVLWSDPFLKPCYLFALVAGDLGMIQDSFTAMSGRVIDLRIYCDKGNEEKCHHAMRSLKKSMKWDEEVFGLEYDLDIFMIVAVDAFNFGAMENKGLNIFNTSCALADEKTATDENFMRVEGVIAHEYFHNWTGDRVTCRDWFQLTLKEGLTVFRDQEFSSDVNSRPVKRIEDVLTLRSTQFSEDSGPTSHPIKPKSYIQINNFYTSTIYNKGAEIIRMIETLIGKENFRKGIDKYFELFDGQAVTTEDFVHAMEEASGVDLSAFSKWYHQSGTPEVHISSEYDEGAASYHVHVKQVNPPTVDQKEKEPLYFPLKIGLIGPDGKDQTLTPVDKVKVEGTDGILIIDGAEQSFAFEKVEAKPVLSVNRGFSAPVKVFAPYSHEERLFLMAHDQDSFNRWDAGQELAIDLILSDIKHAEVGKEISLDKGFIASFGVLLNDQKIDNLFKAKALSLPAESLIGQRQEVIDFDGIHQVREVYLKSLGSAHYDQFIEQYQLLSKKEPFSLDPQAIGRRSLKNAALFYLCYTENPEAFELAAKQFDEASNMTDEFAAFAIIANSNCTMREEVISRFYHKWKDDPLVMCKWLGVQASSKLSGALSRVEGLIKDPIYDTTIPNLVRSLLGGFVQNHVQFHVPNGQGYRFIADQILTLDKINPHVSARLASAFKKYDRLDESRKAVMKQELERILSVQDLSTHTYEIVSKCAH